MSSTSPSDLGRDTDVKLVENSPRDVISRRGAFLSQEIEALLPRFECSTKFRCHTGALHLLCEAFSCIALLVILLMVSLTVSACASVSSGRLGDHVRIYLRDAMTSLVELLHVHSEDSTVDYLRAQTLAFFQSPFFEYWQWAIPLALLVGITVLNPSPLCFLRQVYFLHIQHLIALSLFLVGTTIPPERSCGSEPGLAQRLLLLCSGIGDPFVCSVGVILPQHISFTATVIIACFRDLVTASRHRPLGLASLMMGAAYALLAAFIVVFLAQCFSGNYLTTPLLVSVLVGSLSPTLVVVGIHHYIRRHPPIWLLCDSITARRQAKLLYSEHMTSILLAKGSESRFSPSLGARFRSFVSRILVFLLYGDSVRAQSMRFGDAFR